MIESSSSRQTPVSGSLGERRIGIVGAGFTGALLAVHLVRQARTPTHILLFDRSGRFGPGLAYQTDDQSHLLNVRAANMSAFPDQPDHFVRWLDPLDVSASGIGASGQAFATRGQYGRYLQDVLETARQSAPSCVRFETVAAEITHLEPTATGHQLVDGDGTQYSVDDVVLCLGNFPPRPPALTNPTAFDDPGSVINNPWDTAAIQAIRPDQSVLILGSGLTMVDVVVTLARQGHHAPLTVLSRHGLLPAIHRVCPPWPGFVGKTALPETISARLALVRAEVRRAAAQGVDWRSVVDSLRPYLPDLWRSLSLAEKRRFLRHLRPYWDVHRHRMAPEIAEILGRLLVQERLTLTVGRLVELQQAQEGVVATLRPRGTDTTTTLTVDWVINATGLASDIRQIPDVLVRSLLRDGTVRPDPLAIGLDVSDEGHLIDQNGQKIPGLYALGPLTRSAWWEITAVPELRNQAAQFARLFTGSAHTHRALMGNPKARWSHTIEP